MDKKLMSEIDVICGNKVSSKSSKMIDLYNLGLDLSEIFEVMNEKGVFVSRSNFIYNVVSEYCRLNDVELRVKKKSGVKKEEIEKLFFQVSMCASCYFLRNSNKSLRRSRKFLTLPNWFSSRSISISTSAIKIISVLVVASALIPLAGNAKSQGVNTIDCANCISILCTFGKLPTLPAMAT